MTGSVTIGHGDPFNPLATCPSFDSAHREASKLARNGRHVQFGRIGAGDLFGIWRRDS